MGDRRLAADSRSLGNIDGSWGKQALLLEQIPVDFTHSLHA
jgi:hypothetical protein